MDYATSHNSRAVPRHTYTINPALFAIEPRLEGVQSIDVDEDTFRVFAAYDVLLKSLQEKTELMTLQTAVDDCLHSVGDKLIDGICVVNLDGTIVSINKSYTVLTGLSEEDTLGKDVRELLRCGTIEVSVTPMVLQERRSVSVLSGNPTGDKTYLVTGHPLTGKDGSLVGAMAILHDMTELTSLAQRLEHPEPKQQELDSLKFVHYSETGESSLIGVNPNVKKLRGLIQYIARNDATVLLLGETGVGKEVVAREIHQNSDRKDQPYIRVNCAALPESLIESELFGYEKGAFTGAQNRPKPGMFELANKGTLLLDEISEIPIALQAKLLRVLQEREVTRLGGTRSIKLDVRIIATSNRDLQELINEGKFRSDLYYRLNVLPIKILPLRERADDIPVLAEHFLARLNAKYGTSKVLEDASVQLLQKHIWPGNVRELENVVERLVVSSTESRITCSRIEEFLGDELLLNNTSYSDPNLSLRDAVSSLEKDMIGRALKQFGSTYKVAKALGISQPTAFRKAQEYGLLGDGES